MKLTSVLLLICSCQLLFSQEVSEETFEKIYSFGKTYTASIKRGDIAPMKKSKPPKNTWTYAKLEEYKRNLGSKDILYGQILMPSSDEAYYSYNLFAYDMKKELYYFVAIVSFKITANGAEKKNAYLFTEKKSLKDWWSRTFGFYESELFKKVPEKYKFEFCPPPPFNK